MDKLRDLARRVSRNVEPALQHNGFAIMFVFLYAVVNVVFFVRGGVIGYGLGRGSKYVAIGILARAAGALLNLNSALVIFVASKALMTYLRGTVLNMIVPFDKAMPAMHTIIGNVLALSTLVHAVFQTVNYILNSLWQNPGDRVGIFGWRSVAMTGVFLLLIITAMRTTAMVRVRSKKFEAFYWVHHLGFVSYFALLLIHGVRAGVPMTYRYVAAPVIIYAIDRIYRFLREQDSELVVNRSTALTQQGPGMTMLRVPRTFTHLAGQYCEVRIPDVSLYQWHPFTIASSPHESEMRFFIKDNGDWTHSLHELAGMPYFGDDKLIVHVRGPHGAPAQHVGQYEHVVLVSGGVGATPFASITKYAHHWMLNYTQRGTAEKASVADDFDRHRSVRTPTDYGSGSVSLRSADVSRHRSRSASRSASRSRLGLQTPPRVSTRLHDPAASSLGSMSNLGIAQMQQRSGAAERTRSVRRDTERASETGAQQELARTSDEYQVNLGDPDGPIPRRQMWTAAPATLGAADDFVDPGESFQEYGSSQSLSLADLARDNGVGKGTMDVEVGGVELEEEILRQENTASDSYKKLGMSYDSVSLLRYLQKPGQKSMSSSMMRASMHAIEESLDTAPWNERALFYLHSVTLNWFLLGIMIVRFALFGVGEILKPVSPESQGFDVYNSTPFAIVDLVLAVILIVPVVLAIVIELASRGHHKYFKEDIGNVFEILALLPLLLSSIVLTSIICFSSREPGVIKPLTVFLIWPLTAILLLWRTVRTVGSRVMLAQSQRSTHAQTKSLDFLWVAKKPEEDRWLVEQLLPLAASGFVRLHRFITRASPAAEPWMMNLERVPLKTTYKRPDWDEVMSSLVERSRSGTVIGVFFCGPDSMARMLQQAAMKAMAVSVQNALRRGYVPKKTAVRPGAFGALTRLLGRRTKDVVADLEEGHEGVNSANAYGCNVRIAVRIENFS